MKLMSKLLRYFGYILFRPIWWLERLMLRSNKIWVFGAWYGQKYSDNSKWLYEYVLEHNPEIKAVWITKNRDVYNKLCSQNKPVCLSASAKGVWWCLRAKYAFLTSGVVDVNMFFLNGAKQIWLWHGMPLKKILNCADEWLAVSKGHKIVSKILNPYQSFRPYETVSSSDFFIPYLQQSFDLPESRILKTGLPRCDAFFTDLAEKTVVDIRQKYNGTKILLYMPTFRMSSERNGTPFNPFDSKFNFEQKEFSKFLEQENVFFLYKPHFVDAGVNVTIQSERFKLLNDSQFEDLYVLLNSVDMLITDYSSVFFDFIPSKKPIFLFPFDYEQYLKLSRSHFFNMYEEMSGVICKDWNAFYKNYEEKNWEKTDFNRNNRLAEYLDGKSCEKLVNMIQGKSL